MPLTLSHLLRAPSVATHELAQRARLLHVMLLACSAAAFVMAILNVLGGWWTETILLGSLAAICLLGVLLNHRFRYRAAAWTFFISVWIALAAVSYQGAGLYDEGMVALPVIILGAPFLLGKRAFLVTTLLALATILTFYLLQAPAVFLPPDEPSLNRVIILSAIFLASALICWAVHESWETNLLRLNESYDKTLEGWAKALEYRDIETAGHTRRVTEMAVALARRLNCSREEIVSIRRGAYLHDIGKMAIPDYILQKPGPLDETERKLMQRHPELALHFIADIPFLQSAAVIPHCHHEYWDGSGYPNGLKGEAIPFLARIFTVVDHWDALRSDRPYRKAWTPAQALSHLEANAGKIYDPRIVATFLPIAQKI